MRINPPVIFSVLILILSSNIASLSLGSYMAKEFYYEEGYKEGSVHTAELLQQASEIPPDQQRDIAVKWWTNTKNMKAARDALCGNIKPKKKE